MEKQKKSGAITICLVSDRAIRQLNLMYLAHNIATDVIAFDLSEKKNRIADIAVSTDTAVRNAKAYNTTPLDELYLYVIHGLLHILGCKDNTALERVRMDTKAQRILATL